MPLAAMCRAALAGSGNHRTTEWFALEGTFKDHLVQPQMAMKGSVSASAGASSDECCTDVYQTTVLPVLYLPRITTSSSMWKCTYGLSTLLSVGETISVSAPTTSL